uniref:Uncharacterized protein n=1 Tax=Salix viminalis TaxID=40686 RepID=A0A6N2KRU9_SALVM
MARHFGEKKSREEHISQTSNTVLHLHLAFLSLKTKMASHIAGDLQEVAADIRKSLPEFALPWAVLWLVKRTRKSSLLMLPPWPQESPPHESPMRLFKRLVLITAALQISTLTRSTPTSMTLSIRSLTWMTT